MKLYSEKNDEIECGCGCVHFSEVKVNDTVRVTCLGCGVWKTYEQWQEPKKQNKHATDLFGSRVYSDGQVET